MTSTEGEVPETRDRYGELREFVTGRVLRLQSAYLAGTSAGAATLAVLRRALGTEPGADAEAWQHTLGLPASLAGMSDLPSPAERAVHHSITLFARHQQSLGVGMQRRNYSVGISARQLGRARGNEEAVYRRFTALGTASSLSEVIVHARGLIDQLRSERIPLDYGLLAVHLMKLQHPLLAAGVRLEWGRAYHRAPVNEASTSEPSTTSTQSDES